MWIAITEQEPIKDSYYTVMATVNEGTEHEEYRLTQLYFDGTLWGNDDEMLVTATVHWWWSWVDVPKPDKLFIEL